MSSRQVRRPMLCDLRLVLSNVLHTKLFVHASDILVDGFISHTFSPQDAQDFLALLFKTSDFLQQISYSNLKGVRCFIRNVPYVQPPSLGLPAQNTFLPLDFSVQTTEGTVVPQRRWTPTAVVDVRRHVESGVLELPIFFVNHNGGIGFRLSDILQGRHHDLYNGDEEAPLAGKTTITIRINVSSHMLILVAKILIYVPRSPSQWPGHGHWKRQIPARDESHARRPITVARFMKHVGRSVDKFFNVSSLHLTLCSSSIEIKPLLL